MEASPMIGGDGPKSYSNNSSYQMKGVSSSMDIVRDVISNNEKMSKEELSSWYPFRIADFGCSTGPNTFMVAQFTVDCMLLKYTSHGLPPPEFLVFFNDIPTNDFNSLFLSLSADGGRKYFPAGIPGSFYGRLLPKASLHFGFSSYTLHWLSRVPAAVIDRNSLAWNKGRIHLRGAPAATVRAYGEQFAEDLTKFLNARAVEMVAGGYLVLVFASCVSGSTPEYQPVARIHELIGLTLMEMVEMRIVEEDKVNVFNLPLYFPSLEEVSKLVEEHECFNLESLHALSREKFSTAQQSHSHMRAAIENVLSTHFGEDTVNQLFELTATKFQEHYQSIISGQVGRSDDLCVLLRRNSCSYSHKSVLLLKF